MRKERRGLLLLMRKRNGGHFGMRKMRSLRNFLETLQVSFLQDESSSFVMATTASRLEQGILIECTRWIDFGIFLLTPYALRLGERLELFSMQCMMSTTKSQSFPS
jgi:hypothetical protein